MSFTDEMMKMEYFTCDCSDFDHTFRISYFNDHNENDDYMYVIVSLREKTFFKRLWAGIKYIFGKTSKYGHWDEFLLSPKEVKRLRDVCVDYLKKDEK